jgi:hypothetical protein
VTSRKDDPAFLISPSNYRWSMGLLICLRAGLGATLVDELSRLATALRTRVKG